MPSSSELYYTLSLLLDVAIWLVWASGMLANVLQIDGWQCPSEAYLSGVPGPRQCVCYAANGCNSLSKITVLRTVQPVQQYRHTSSKPKFHVFLLQIVLTASHAEFHGNDDHSSTFQTLDQYLSFRHTLTQVGIRHKAAAFHSQCFLPSTIFILKLRKPEGKWVLGFQSQLIRHLIFMIFQILCPIF